MQRPQSTGVSAIKVAVVGGLNMDLIVQVPMLPRPGETIAGGDLLRAAGGKGGNQAVAAARLGAQVTLVGRVGRDAFGRELSRGLRDQGVSTHWLLASDRPTGAALILVDERGENVIAVAPGANFELSPEEVPRRVIAAADVVLAGLEVPLASVEQAFRLARTAGGRTVLNAAPAQPISRTLLELCDVVICNAVELAMLLGQSELESSEASAARELAAFPGQIVVVTLGSRGAIASCDAESFQQPAFQVQVVDTVGAGDGFVAGFVVGRWWSDGVANALRWGCAAGALATTVRGAQPAMPALSDVLALLAS